MADTYSYHEVNYDGKSGWRVIKTDSSGRIVESRSFPTEAQCISYMEKKQNG
jgi:hypothetical protein